MKIHDNQIPKFKSLSIFQPSMEDERTYHDLGDYKNLENISFGLEFFAIFSKSMINKGTKIDP